MGKQVARIGYRFQYAAMQKDATTHWDQVAAVVEEANIKYHGLAVEDATKMKGNSKITFKISVRNLLDGMELEEEMTMLIG